MECEDKIFDYKANCAGNIGNISEQFNTVNRNFIHTLWARRIFTIISEIFFVHSTTMNAKNSLILIKIHTLLHLYDSCQQNLEVCHHDLRNEYGKKEKNSRR